MLKIYDTYARHFLHSIQYYFKLMLDFVASIFPATSYFFSSFICSFSSPCKRRLPLRICYSIQNSITIVSASFSTYSVFLLVYTTFYCIHRLEFFHILRRPLMQIEVSISVYVPLSGYNSTVTVYEHSRFVQIF